MATRSLSRVMRRRWVSRRALLRGIGMDSVHAAAKTTPKSCSDVPDDVSRSSRSRSSPARWGRMRFSPSCCSRCCGCSSSTCRSHTGYGGRLPETTACSISPAAPWCTSMPASPGWSPRCAVKRRGYGTENLAPYDLSLAVIGTGCLGSAGSGSTAARRSAPFRALVAIVRNASCGVRGALT